MNNDHSNPPAPAKPSTVVYACSGCSDAGELADRIARQLTRDGAAQMSCLAGIGGRVKSLVAKAENAERILAIDGCPLNCTRHTLELAGFKNFEHLELHKVGIRKGSAPVTDERIASGVTAAKKILAGDVDAKENRAENPRTILSETSEPKN
ncbi:MAG: putative zinc-binding protein [Verrucomicrobiales bacterium]|nr:putative zinc-binding protein [Verrucomicrobiales bacterium]